MKQLTKRKARHRVDNIHLNVLRQECDDAWTIVTFKWFSKMVMSDYFSKCNKGSRPPNVSLYIYGWTE